ncbi:CysZ protein [Allopseudospirillum japonicum]|uniref:Sulfate transporter CysZ n=1 Tax=Allopseudospirillum japonicum TaxID=64971 RepID=A0A1H6R6R8_9GAMM|nr:sulfate transporter CysZ [Allopseudospirillum japonicum]SEI51501.1 CysZ protein [Allopseudospirillum japonicum]
MLFGSQRAAAHLGAGFLLILKPKLRRFVYLPVLINIGVFAGLFYWAWQAFSDWSLWMSQQIPDWLAWLEWLLWPVFILGILLGLVFGFTLIVHLISAPFMGLLAEKVEEHLTGVRPMTDEPLWPMIQRTFAREWTKIAYMLPRLLGLVILSFIPVVNLIAPLLWFMFNAWMLAIQYLDYPMDNHRISFDAMRTQLAQKRVQSLSFGACVSVLTPLPLINLVLMPAAVAGATQMWVQEFSSSANPS